MKIGILSDAHGNAAGLQRCVRVLCDYGQAEKLFFLGDAVGYGLQAKETLKLIAQNDIQCVMGNHDAMLLGQLPIAPEQDEVYQLKNTAQHLTRDDKQQMAAWPQSRTLHADGLDLLICHGSPLDHLTGYVYPDSDLSVYLPTEYDVVVMGHSHWPFVREEGATVFVNAGSCGLPRDQGYLLSCALIDTVTREFKVLRIPFDVEDWIARWGVGVHSEVLTVMRRRRDAPIVGEVIEDSV